MKEVFEKIISPRLRTANGKVVSVEGIMHLYVRMGDLRVRSWFGVVENLVIDVLLGTSFMYRCIRRIFPSEQKIVSLHSRPLANISTQRIVNTITADTEENNVHTIADHGISSEKHYFCRVARQVTVTAYSHAAVLVSCLGAVLMTIEIHQIVVECR